MRREALHHANRAVSYARERGAMTTLPFSLQVQAAALIGESRFDLASVHPRGHRRPERLAA
jgi:hypothetical protein